MNVNRQVWLSVLGLVAVAALALAAWAMLGATPPAPLRTRLDVNLGEPSTVYTTQAGEYAVTLTLEPKGDDNGPVLITITTNGQSVGQIESLYDYDFFSDEPAGEMWLAWVDNDAARDIVISTPYDGMYYISSRDGRLYTLPEK